MSSFPPLVFKISCFIVIIKLKLGVSGVFSVFLQHYMYQTWMCVLQIQSYLSFCMASGQGVRLCIMGGYSFSGVCIPELYYIMCPIRASPPGLTLPVMAISRVIGHGRQRNLEELKTGQKTGV